MSSSSETTSGGGERKEEIMEELEEKGKEKEEKEKKEDEEKEEALVTKTNSSASLTNTTTSTTSTGRQSVAPKELRFSDATLNHLAMLMARPPNGIVLRDRRYRLRMIRNCFQATELIEWLMSKLKWSKEDALFTGQEMVNRKVITHVVNKDKPFTDCASLYYFSEDIRKMVQDQIEEQQKEEQAASHAKPPQQPEEDEEDNNNLNNDPEPTSLSSSLSPSPSSTSTSALASTTPPIPEERRSRTSSVVSLPVLNPSTTPPSSAPSPISTPPVSTTSVPELSRAKSFMSLFTSRKKIDAVDPSAAITSSTDSISTTPPGTETHAKSASIGNLLSGPSRMTSAPSATTSTFAPLLRLFGHKSREDISFPISPDPKLIATPESLKKLQLRRQKLREKKKKNKGSPSLDKKVKLLLLGVGDCGKSTLLRQWRLMIRNDFGEPEQRRGFIPIINECTINCLQTLLAIVVSERREQKQQEGSLLSTEEAERALDRLLHLDEPICHLIDPEMAADLKLLWSEPLIQSTYQSIINENSYIIDHSTKYFLDSVDRIADMDYVPSAEDLLRVRTPATSISELDFNITNLTETWRIVDTGGSTAGQKVWVHCFQDVTFLAYMVDAASVFDEVVDPVLSPEASREGNLEFWMEDNNPMYDSLRVFNELCHLKWFAKTTILLFINKINVLQERMGRKSGVEQLKHFFPEYRGGDDWRAALSFIQQQFVVQNPYPNRAIHCFYVHAITPDEIRVRQTFESIQQVILEELVTLEEKDS